jgi:hypothetical protein
MLHFVDQNGPTIVPPLLEATLKILRDIKEIPDSFPTWDFTDGSNLNFLRTLDDLLPLYSKLLSHLSILQAIYQSTTNAQGRTNIAFTLPFTNQENIEIISLLGNIVKYYIVTFLQLTV